MNEELVKPKINSFPKIMRVSHKKRLDLLFTKGESFIAYPLRVVFVKREKEEGSELSMVISVSKRKFKRAVKRNRMKRLIRENFRVECHSLEQELKELPFSLDVAYLYLKDELTDYDEINKAITKSIDVLKVKIQ